MTMTSVLGHYARCALREQGRAYRTRRGLASAASGSFTYETGETAGIKFASRDLPGPTTHVAVVAKAGTRYQPMPGFTDALEQFAFKVSSIFNTAPESPFWMEADIINNQNTTRRSALRITREAELLGSELQSYHSRENLIIGARFLRDDLPYFVELLGEVASNTKYTRMLLRWSMTSALMRCSRPSIPGGSPSHHQTLSEVHARRYRPVGTQLCAWCCLPSRTWNTIASGIL